MNDKKSFTDIIKDAYRIFSTNKMKLLMLTFFCYFPVQLVMNVVDLKLSTDVQIDKILESNMMSPEDAERILPYYLILALLSILSLVFQVAVAKLVYDESSFLDYEENAPVLDYMSFSVKKLPTVFLTCICFVLAATLGFMLFFIPGIIVIMAMLPIVPMIVYSEKTGFKSLGFSLRMLFKKPSISFCVLICDIITALFSGAVLTAFDKIGLTGIWNVVLSAVVSMAITYFLLIVQIIPYLFYLNRIEFQIKD